MNLNLKQLIPTPVPTPSPKGYLPASPISPPMQTPVPTPAPIQIPSASGKGITTLPQNLSNSLLTSFDDVGEATRAAQVMHHPPQSQIKGYGTGENTQFQTGPTPTDFNSGSIINPFTGLAEKSEDRGALRINNGTFYDLLRRKPKTMEALGLTSYRDFDKMYDPELNIRVARIIFDEGGWNRWYGAPSAYKIKP